MLGMTLVTCCSSTLMILEAEVLLFGEGLSILTMKIPFEGFWSYNLCMSNVP